MVMGNFEFFDSACPRCGEPSMQIPNRIKMYLDVAMNNINLNTSTKIFGFITIPIIVPINVRGQYCAKCGFLKFSGKKA